MVETKKNAQVEKVDNSKKEKRLEKVNWSIDLRRKMMIKLQTNK
jgi:hypothetical protein